MTSDLRIALLSYRSKAHCGGQGVYIRHLSRELAALGHHVEVFSGQPFPELDPGPILRRVPSLDLYRDPDPFRTPRLNEFRDAIDVLEVAQMWAAGFPEPLTFSLRAARILSRRRSDFDVVHDNQSLGYGLLRIAAAGLPVVATVHHPISVDRRVEIAAAPDLRRRLTLRRWYAFARMQARVARRMPRVITVSESSAGDIVRDYHVERQRIHVVPAGVDSITFRPPDEATAPRVSGRILAVSSSESPMKGLRILLDAVAKVRTETDVELVVIGRLNADGPIARALDELDLRNAVRFVSDVDDDELARLMGSAQVAVVPSLYEGFSLPAIEAMACATPLVVAGAGALPEVVGPSGSCARIVPPGDAQALAREIRALLADAGARASMGAAGRVRATKHYGWRTAAQRTVAVYRDAIANQSVPC